MSAHNCPGPGCQAQVPRSRLACAVHWAQVSKEGQKRVYAAHRSGNMLAHILAMNDAIEEMS